MDISVLGTEVSEGDTGSVKTLNFPILTNLRVDMEMSELKGAIENLPVMCWNGCPVRSHCVLRFYSLARRVCEDACDEGMVEKEVCVYVCLCLLFLCMWWHGCTTETLL